MAAALRAAEGGGGIFFPNPQGGYFQNFSGQGGYTPYPPYSRPLNITLIILKLKVNKYLLLKLLMINIYERINKISKYEYYAISLY